MYNTRMGVCPACISGTMTLMALFCPSLVIAGMNQVDLHREQVGIAGLCEGAHSVEGLDLTLGMTGETCVPLTLPKYEKMRNGYTFLWPIKLCLVV